MKAFFSTHNAKETVQNRVINEVSPDRLYNNSCDYDFQSIESDDCDLALDELDSIITRDFQNACPIKSKTITRKTEGSHRYRALSNTLQKTGKMLPFILTESDKLDPNINLPRISLQIKIQDSRRLL